MTQSHKGLFFLKKVAEFLEKQIPEEIEENDQNQAQHLKSAFAGLEENLGYTFTNRELLKTACTHRSYIQNDQRNLIEDNAKLEWLGDAVLQIIVTEYLYINFPKGNFVTLREQHVCNAKLIEIGQRIDIPRYLRCEAGLRNNENYERTGSIGDAVEAILGAIYLDGGIHEARRVCLALFFQKIDEATKKSEKIVLETEIRNAIYEVKSYAKKYGGARYRIIKINYGETTKEKYIIELLIENKRIATGSGSSEKAAKQNAASNAVKIIREKIAEKEKTEI